MQNPVTYLETVEDAEDFADPEDGAISLILFGKDEKKTYESAADQLRGFAKFSRTRVDAIYSR